MEMGGFRVANNLCDGAQISSRTLPDKAEAPDYRRCGGTKPGEMRASRPASGNPAPCACHLKSPLQGAHGQGPPRPSVAALLEINESCTLQKTAWNAGGYVGKGCVANCRGTVLPSVTTLPALPGATPNAPRPRRDSIGRQELRGHLTYGRGNQRLGAQGSWQSVEWPVQQAMAT